MIENNIYLIGQRASPLVGAGSSRICKATRRLWPLQGSPGAGNLTNAMFGRRGDHPLPEMPVPLKLVTFAVERLKASTPAMTPGAPAVE
ncbi:hypothetical protein CN203_04170 [Sinorhizobium meliloti]|nr:hypothetical protein CN222_06700 [Sinorhizobium meliloti]RVH59287.1 hypothetical protein CN213_07765 [Sinorhizobium meliloti]RVH80543.1 hypothetical protein CN203_04170 [Sinorhizobium meliloti]RVI17511.1 hypothetical protein CN207_36850 [Sinorhizobium meliloti]RVM26400.1 hypothetical protein CN129_29355 [Sinorhizobium meliloti]